MKAILLEYLVCPSCNGDFTFKIKKTSNNEIIEGKFSCQKCKDTFLLINGIPRFVKDTDKDFIKTEDSFSAKWKKHYSNHQAQDWIDFQKQWFFDRFGWKTLKRFTTFIKSKKLILEAGTGIGNTADLLSTNSSSTVFAIDASESIDFAFKKYGKKSNLHFLQADLRKLPFKKKFFDYILSDQVLHHTKNTKTSFKYLTKFLKTDGLISIMFIIRKHPFVNFLMIILEKQP